MQDLYEKKRELEEKEQREKKEEEKLETIKKKEKHEQSANASTEVKQILQVTQVNFVYELLFIILLMDGSKTLNRMVYKTFFNIKNSLVIFTHVILFLFKKLYHRK